MRLIYEPKRLWPVVAIASALIISGGLLEYARTKSETAQIGSSAALEQARKGFALLNDQPDPIRPLLGRKDPDSMAQLIEIASTRDVVTEYRLEAMREIVWREPHAADVIIARLLDPSEPSAIREYAVTGLEALRCSEQCKERITDYLEARRIGVPTREEEIFRPRLSSRPEVLGIFETRNKEHNDYLENRLRNIVNSTPANKARPPIPLLR